MTAVLVIQNHVMEQVSDATAEKGSLWAFPLDPSAFPLSGAKGRLGIEGNGRAMRSLAA